MVSTRKLIGHCHGLEVISPSFGFNPAFPWNMTACDSMNRSRKLGAYTSKLTFGTGKRFNGFRFYKQSEGEKIK